jgi:predicted transcriptional regulator
MIPQRLGDIIFNVLGNASAQIKIMMVLCGTKEEFFISAKWITKRTGLSQQSYSAALRKLVKRGWVKHINYSHITVDYNRIYEDGRIFDEKYQ